jgi:hypothetical protein
MNCLKRRPIHIFRPARIVPVLALLAALGIGATPARADALMTIGIQSLSVGPGGSGAFDVLVTNNSGGTINLAGFSFEVDTTDTDITLNGSTINTSTPYIFAGNSGFGPTLNLDSPGQVMDGEDIAATPNSFTAVADGATYGLGNVTFSVSLTAAPGSIATLTINPDPAFTSLTDDGGNPVSFNSTTGTITVSIVPEPSTWLLIAAATPLLWLGRRRRSDFSILKAPR